MLSRIIWQYWQDQSSASSTRKYLRKYPRNYQNNAQENIQEIPKEIPKYKQKYSRNALDYWLMQCWVDNLTILAGVELSLDHVDLLKCYVNQFWTYSNFYLCLQKSLTIQFGSDFSMVPECVKLTNDVVKYFGFSNHKSQFWTPKIPFIFTASCFWCSYSWWWNVFLLLSANDNSKERDSTAMLCGQKIINATVMAGFPI